MYRHRKRVLYQPALVRLGDALNSMIEALAPGADRLRFRVEPGRIKSADRLLQKARQEAYASRVLRVEDIFDIVGDIVGTRVTTNTASDAWQVFSWAHEYCSASRPSRTMKHLVGRDNDYFSEPKESGYRALHLGLSVNVPQGVSETAVACEVQIRTVLQDAWGELTHEDTVNAGSRISGSAGVPGARLATTLAAMDEMAQDLRDDHDRSKDEVPAQR